MQVKAESQPTRCEICHKDDCFDPNNNYCTRCNTGSTYTSKYKFIYNRNTFIYYLDKVRAYNSILKSFLFHKPLLFLRKLNPLNRNRIAGRMLVNCPVCKQINRIYVNKINNQRPLCGKCKSQLVF